MKEYMIISETLKEADYMYRRTINALHPFIFKTTRTPIRTIENSELRLCFTCMETWWHNYRYGRRDAETMWDFQFEQMLDELRMAAVSKGEKR